MALLNARKPPIPFLILPTSIRTMNEHFDEINHPRSGFRRGVTRRSPFWSPPALISGIHSPPPHLLLSWALIRQSSRGCANGRIGPGLFRGCSCAKRKRRMNFCVATEKELRQGYLFRNDCAQESRLFVWQIGNGKMVTWTFCSNKTTKTN